MLLDRLRVFRTHPGLAWPLILGNLVAVWYGWTDYYAAQFAATPKVDWVWVADSPNAVLLFAVALLASQFRRRFAWLDLLAWVANIKVGLWTVFVLLYYFKAFFADDPVLRWILFWLHVGMIAQAFVLHRDLRTAPPGRLAFALVVAWTLVGDYMDYVVGLHPYLRGPSHPVVSTVTLFISAVTLGLAALLYRRRPAPAQQDER